MNIKRSVHRSKSFDLSHRRVVYADHVFCFAIFLLPFEEPPAFAPGIHCALVFRSIYYYILPLKKNASYIINEIYMIMTNMFPEIIKDHITINCYNKTRIVHGPLSLFAAPPSKRGCNCVL